MTATASKSIIQELKQKAQMLKTRYKNDGRATLVLLISNQGHEGDLHGHLSRCGIPNNSSNPSQVFRDIYTHTILTNS